MVYRRSTKRQRQIRPDGFLATTPRSSDVMRRGAWSGEAAQELVQVYASRDMVVLAVVEHGHGEVGGLPAQDWPLRVTLIYVKAQSGGWRIAMPIRLLGASRSNRQQCSLDLASHQMRAMTGVPI